jgi:hypothetical protein
MTIKNKNWFTSWLLSDCFKIPFCIMIALINVQSCFVKVEKKHFTTSCYVKQENEMFYATVERID